jgi:hypothetical protein
MDFKMYPSSKRTMRKKAIDEEMTRIALLSNISRVPDHHIEEPLLHNEIRKADESSAPQLIKGCGPQRSGDNMIPLAFNRLQHRNNHTIGDISEVAPRQNVSPYEMNLAVRQTFPIPFTSKSEDVQPFSAESMDYQESRQHLWSDVDRLMYEFAQDRYTFEADSGSVNNGVFSSAYAASMRPSTPSDNNQNGDISSHGLPLGYDEDFNGYTGLPESIDNHYRYYGLNMQISQENEALREQSYKSGTPSSEAEDEDSDMMEADYSDVPLSVGLPPPEKNTKSGIVAPHDARYLELFELGSYPGGGLADGLPRDTDGYNLYGNTITEAAYPFHSGPNPLALMSSYEHLDFLTSEPGHHLPSSLIGSWSETYGDVMTDAMVEQKQTLTVVKPE